MALVIRKQACFNFGSQSHIPYELSKDDGAAVKTPKFVSFDGRLLFHTDTAEYGTLSHHQPQSHSCVRSPINATAHVRWALTKIYLAYNIARYYQFPRYIFTGVI